MPTGEKMDFEQEKKEHPDEQWFCSACGAENYGLAYWCIKCGAFPQEENNKKTQQKRHSDD
jgi:DNA-directed RNA polymerase subunit RPC12/RpoP